MANLEIDGNTPQTVRKIAAQLRRIGWLGFWSQLVLAIVSTAIFIFALAISGSSANNPATGGSLLFSIGGLLLLYASTFWSFNYMQIARKLKNPDLRPKKANTIQTIQRGILLSVLGMGSSVLGAEAIGGTLLAKSFSSISVSMGFFSPDALTKIIQPLDISIVLANTHTITAHFIGIVCSLWLLSRISNPGQ
jgi:Protein of unknown function (DUF3611)